MAEVMPVEPVIRFCAVISADTELRERAIAKTDRSVGACFSVRSGPLPFEAGGYYAETMGLNLKKVLVGFDQIRWTGQRFRTGKRGPMKWNANSKRFRRPVRVR